MKCIFPAFCPGRHHPKGYDLHSLGPNGKGGDDNDIWSQRPCPPDYSSLVGRRRPDLISLRRRFDCRRRTRLPALARVGRRILGAIDARRMSSTSRSRASLRFCSRVRCRLASISSTPCPVMRDPARRMSRRRTSSGSEGDAATLNLNSTAVETLFTFCPPGPEERTNSSCSSRGSIEIALVMRIISGRFLLGHTPRADCATSQATAGTWK